TLDLPRAGQASLELYSVSGQRVRTLANGAFAAGRHTLTWDARGRDGEAVAPGLYFAVLEQGGQRVQQRVVRVQ
ncbi:MAG: T9SS type A sorting domain-containing protein, partial [Candidatus Eisenbacteria bacterium]|nr:T9SS type A sorting domain-containing protein [Candidatus Eisenbacteria bacterium]